MQVPLEISYRNINKTENLDALVREKTDKLEKICDHITSGHIAIEKPQESIKSGNPNRVRLEFRIPPQHQVVIRREPGEGDMHQSLETVIIDAFDAARRQITEIVEKQRTEVKKHSDQEVAAVVSKIFHDEDYGFLETVNGREIYFHRNSVINEDFENIKAGAGVRFFEDLGIKGPKASSVHLIDNPANSNN